MNPRSWLALGVVVACAWPPVRAAPPAEPGHEIAALLRKLSASACRFQRNGAWYTAQEASEHLARKWRYMVRWLPASTTADFVAMAASHSSETGRPYTVLCKGTGETQARAWLLRELATLRRESAAAPREPLK